MTDSQQDMQKQEACATAPDGDAPKKVNVALRVYGVLMMLMGILDMVVFLFTGALLGLTLYFSTMSPELAGMFNALLAVALNDWGYKTTGPGWLEASLTRLGHRLECRQTHDPDGGFPHEVGLFLGYPYDDVMAFIEHEGRDYLCCGCWKVYSHREQAEACFERYKRCTRDCEEMLGHGATLAQLAVTRVAA